VWIEGHNRKLQRIWRIRGHLTIKVPIFDVKEVVPTNSGVC